MFLDFEKVETPETLRQAAAMQCKMLSIDDATKERNRKMLLDAADYFERKEAAAAAA